MRNKIFKKVNGITLIALVITIIVMLILVAVTINMAVNGGLFGYAGNATSQTKLAKEDEQNYTNLESNMTTDQLIEKFTTNNKKWTHTGTGTAVGDVYTTGTESFYLIASDSTTVTLLAVNCVDTRAKIDDEDNENYNKQRDDAPTVAFDTTAPYSNVYAESTIKALVDSYVESLGVEVEEGRLLLNEDVWAIGGNPEYPYSTADCPDFLNEKTFWLGSPGNNNGGTAVTAFRLIANYRCLDKMMPRC